MAYSGYINWHRLERGHTVTAGRHTYVYAYWLVDYGASRQDHGIEVLKRPNTHPDWFLHAQYADHVLAAYVNPKSVVSPAFVDVYHNLAAKPLLAAVCMGTSDRAYRLNSASWWCAREDLTWRGRRLLKQMERLYLRPAHIVTFIDAEADEEVGSRDPR